MSSSVMMMQKLMEMKNLNEKKKTRFEIDVVKDKPNPKNLAVVAGYSEIPNKEKHILKPCGSSNSRIIRLSNVVTEDDFESDEDYENILTDLRDCGAKFGKLMNVVIPRSNPGVGKVFIEYEDLNAASRARSALNGIPIGLDNYVVADYYPENMYAQGYLDA